MQLDLLQDDVATKPENQPSEKKSKRPQRHYPKLEITPDDSSAVLPQLPASLLAPFQQGGHIEETQDDKADDFEKAPGAFKTISETAKFLDVPQHVLRFWESRFAQIKPLKLNGGRRYYRPQDIEILSTIKHLLYKQGYTIKGAKKAFAAEKQSLAVTVAEPVAVAVQHDKNLAQLRDIRQELIELRNSIKGYIAK